MRRQARAAWILGVTLTLAMWSPHALADDEAVTRFERGVQLYEAENYDGALVEFNTAYKLSNNYKLLYNIGICHTALKDYSAAADTFQKYLTDGGAEVSEGRRADVRERLSKLSLMVTRIQITTDAPAGATLLVDDQAVGTTPLPESIAVKIGRRQFSITSEGKTVTKTIDVASGDRNPAVQLNIVTQASPLTAPEAPPVTVAHSGPSFPWAFWGLTAVLGGAAAVTGTLAVAARNDFEQKQATYGVDPKALDDDRSTARTFGVVTDVLLVGTVLSAGLSTYLTIVHFGNKKSSTSITILPAGVGYARTF